MIRRFVRALFRLLFRFHFLVVTAIVLFVSAVISLQITDRAGFADGELHQDVMERWGAPILQPVPSVRYVVSGTVFNTLRPLPFEKQSITVDAEMNYRKRGLVYFSGFQFVFQAHYEVRNPEDKDIDLVFVFPIQLQRNQVLLSNLSFSVNGKGVPLQLSDETDKLVWTGRLKAGETFRYDIAFGGRGLDSFLYQLDPALRVENFALEFRVKGGHNFDYPAGVVPSSNITVQDDVVTLRWDFGSLESGVPVGLILPSEQSYDRIIATILERGWVPFLLLWAGIVALYLRAGRGLKLLEAVLLGSAFALFYILLAYLSAFLHFYAAYVVSLILVHAIVVLYLRTLLSNGSGLIALGLCAAFLLVPSLAVILEGYTGLIYTIEITACVIAVMFLSTRAGFERLFQTATAALHTPGGNHVS